MTDPTPQTTPPATSDRWALLEVFGHRSHVGRLREVAQFGVPLAQIEVICSDCGAVGGPRHTHLYAGSAIFSVTDLADEADARKRAREHYGQKCEACRTRGLAPPALRAAGCTGMGCCHGSMKWCDGCGDVSKVCDDPHCHQHALEQEGDGAVAALPTGPCELCERPDCLRWLAVQRGEVARDGWVANCAYHAGLRGTPPPVCDHSGIGLPGCKTCDPRTVSEGGPQPDAPGSDDDRMLDIGTPPPAPATTDQWTTHRDACETCSGPGFCETGKNLFDNEMPF